MKSKDDSLDQYRSSLESEKTFFVIELGNVSIEGYKVKTQVDGENP